MNRKKAYTVDATPSALEVEMLEELEAVAQESSDLLVDFGAKIREGSSQYKVFRLLSDKQWHCRTCEGKQVGSDQYAGGGGIQGLQRGTRSRDGIVIVSEKRFCTTCARVTTQDRWTGETKTSNAAANIPAKLIDRVLKVYGYEDALENRQRQKHELVVDHRFPMQRWGDSEPPHDVNMGVAEIKAKFQLLKKDEGGNHNLLKSRACEHCLETRERGTPLGIRFWYEGGEQWPITAEVGPEAEAGCVGCGWYDLQAWRQALNQILAEPN